MRTALILLLALAAPAAAQAPAATIPTADLATVAARGARLYAFDQAAWHTTDAMVAAGLPRAAMESIRDWVVEPRDAAQTVTYYAVAADGPSAVYIADYARGAVSNGHVPTAAERALSPLGQRMAAARGVAFAQVFPLCAAQPFNTVILPPEASGVVPVYLLTPMVETGVYPFGGHHEVDVAPDGKVAATRDFTRSCLPMKEPAAAAGSKVAALVVSHLLDPHPTELHVYLSLWSGRPVYVVTGKDVTWRVAGTKIERVDAPK